MAGSIKNLEKFKKILVILGHTSMGLQILAVLLIFFCSSYIALGIIHSHVLDFATPFINWLKDMTVLLFGSSIKSAQPEVDGRLVLFMLFMVVIAFFVSQLKQACMTFSKNLDKTIIEIRKKEESAFNKHLEDELKQNTLSQKNYLFIIQFKAKSMLIENVVGAIELDIEKIKEEIMEKFFEQIKTNGDLKFTKDKNTLIISSNDINKVDRTIERIFEIVESLKAEYKNRKLNIKAKIAAESFDNSISLSNAYKNVLPLLGLNSSANEILCYGNFRNRYNFVANTKYKVVVKGKYDMVSGNEETVWSLVKKI